MLWEDAKGARRICFRILFCNAVMLCGFGFLMEAWRDQRAPEIYALLLWFGAAAVIFFMIVRWMREVQVTLKRLRVPVFVMLMPSVMICFCSGFLGIQNPCLLSSFLLPAFLLMMIWYHRQMKHLPMALERIVPRLEGSHPGIFREDLMRISDETFAKEMSEALDAVPEEKINDELRDAVIDWYSVYVSAAVVLEGVFAVVCILAALNWQD